MKNIHIISANREPVKGDVLLRHLWKNTTNECISWWRYDNTITIEGTTQYTTLNGTFRDITSSFKVQNIHITGNEKIKEGDWGLSKLNEVILFGRNYNEKFYKKIILTTDPELIKDGVQAIPDEFPAWFVKNPSCEEIDITRANKCKIVNCDLECILTKACENIYYGYKIIIPKEEQYNCTNKCVNNDSNTCKGIKETCIQCGGTGETTHSQTYNSQHKCDLCDGRGYWNREIISKEESKQHFTKGDKVLFTGKMLDEDVTDKLVTIFYTLGKGDYDDMSEIMDEYTHIYRVWNKDLKHIKQEHKSLKELNRIDDKGIEEMSFDWETMSQQIKSGQETLEEAVSKFFYYKKHPTSLEIAELGAKWQQDKDNKELAMWKLAVERQEARCKALKDIISDLQGRTYNGEDMRGSV